MNAADRLEELINQGIAARRWSSTSDFLRRAGFKSRGQLKSWRTRLEKNPQARMKNMTQIARLLGMSVESLELHIYGSEQSTDPYPSREYAVSAARDLQLPEAAIQNVLSEDPGTDPGRWYWFKRIEAEAARLAPVASVSR